MKYFFQMAKLKNNDTAKKPKSWDWKIGKRFSTQKKSRKRSIRRLLNGEWNKSEQSSDIKEIRSAVLHFVESTYDEFNIIMSDLS